MENKYLKIILEDDGVGFDSSIVKKHPKSKFGLFSINERIKILNGQFSIDSVLGNGTKITITIPIEDGSHQLQTKD